MGMLEGTITAGGRTDSWKGRGWGKLSVWEPGELWAPTGLRAPEIPEITEETTLGQKESGFSPTVPR